MQALSDHHAAPTASLAHANIMLPFASASARDSRLQFGLQFTTVRQCPGTTGQRRWSGLNLSGRPRPELLMWRTVQHGSTATSPDSHKPGRPSAHRASWDDGQTPSDASSSGRRGRFPGHSTATAANTAAITADNHSHPWTTLEYRPSARTAVDGPGRYAYSYGSVMRYRRVGLLMGGGRRRYRPPVQVGWCWLAGPVLRYLGSGRYWRR
jgi:hypothetical protein